MKILSIIHNTQPGGVQRVSAIETAMLNKFGYKTSLVSILKTYEWDLFKRVKITPIYLYDNEFFGRLFSGLYVKCRIEIDSDIIIAHNNPSVQVALMLKKKMKRKGKNVLIISYLHDILIYPITGSLFGEVLRIFPQLLKKLEREHIIKSEIILVNSKTSFDRIMKNYNLKNLSEKVFILYPTVNIPVSKKMLVKDKKGYMLIVGRMDHEAFYNLYKIMKILDYPLIIAGYGHPYNPNFRKILMLFKMLKKAGKKIKIIFCPSDVQLFELYRNASLFVYPGHENFNMSAIEAMSAGCPVLVANTSGVCEILPQELREELGLDKNDVRLWVEKINEIIKSDRSYELGEKCWKVTHKYNLYTHMDKLIGILKGLV